MSYSSPAIHPGMNFLMCWTTTSQPILLQQVREQTEGGHQMQHSYHLYRPTSFNEQKSKFTERFSANCGVEHKEVLGLSPVEFLDDPDTALELALQESMQQFEQEECELIESSSVTNTPEKEIQGLFLAHSKSVISGPDRNLTISRNNLLHTSLPYFQRRAFMARKGLLKVVFSTDEYVEDAADLGGPRREFFRLLLAGLCQGSGMLEASPNGMVIRPCISKYQQGMYKIMGEMVATCITQGGESPAIFAPSVVEYIVHGDIAKVKGNIEDIPQENIRKDLKMMNAAKDEAELSNIMEKAEWRYEIPGIPTFVRMSKRDVFVQEVSLYMSVLKAQGMVDQFIQGLKYYEVLEFLRKYEWSSVLKHDPTKAYTAESLLATFQTRFSVVGSNRRNKEEQVMSAMRVFCFKAEDKELASFLPKPISEKMKSFSQSMTLAHIMAFATGCGRAPAADFHPTPEITFVHDDEKNFPIAQTCSNTLTLFVNDTNTSNEKFALNMLTALMNGATFSTA